MAGDQFYQDDNIIRYVDGFMGELNIHTGIKVDGWIAEKIDGLVTELTAYMYGKMSQKAVISQNGLDKLEKAHRMLTRLFLSGLETWEKYESAIEGLEITRKEVI